MFPLSLHGSAVFQEAQFLWEQQPWQTCTCRSLGNLGLLGFFPLKAAVETNIKGIFQCSHAAELGLFLKNGDNFVGVLSAGSRNKITSAVV